MAETCLDDHRLGALAEGSVSEDDRAHIEDHSRACADCAELVATLQNVFGGPQAVGRYEIVKPLGQGGMGIVYEARDPVLGRRVAVKVLLRDEAEQNRLLREAQAMARLAHPNVVMVYDAGVEGGRVFVAMELVRGTSLRVHLNANPNLPIGERLRLYRQAAAGLVAAHEANVVHRDFKPENVLVGVMGARVVDFGLARPESVRLVDDVPLSSDQMWVGETATRGIHGTPAYMSPEQLAGRDVDARTDQFSFAVALWESAYGAHPFGVGRAGPKTLVDLRSAIARGPQRGDRAGAPAWLEPVLRRALAEDPGQRFATMKDLATALEGPEAEAKPLLDKLVSLLAVMVVLHVGVLATLVAIWFGMPGDDDPGSPFLAELIAMWTLLFWGPVGIAMAPLAAFAVRQRKRWAFVVTAVYAAISAPTILGTPFAIFAAYILSRPAVRAAFGHQGSRSGTSSTLASASTRPEAETATAAGS